MDRDDMRHPGDAEDRADAGLDAVLFAAGDRMLDAIRRSLDLDAGLAQIIGDPPREEAAGSREPAGAGKKLAGTSATPEALSSEVTSRGPRSHQHPAVSGQLDAGEAAQGALAPVAAEEPAAVPGHARAKDDERRDRHEGSDHIWPTRLVITAAVIAGACTALTGTAVRPASWPLVIGLGTLSALAAAGISCILVSRRVSRLILAAIAEIMDETLAAIRKMPLASYLKGVSPRKNKRMTFLAAASGAAAAVSTAFLAAGVSQVAHQSAGAAPPIIAAQAAGDPVAAQAVPPPVARAAAAPRVTPPTAPPVGKQPEAVTAPANQQTVTVVEFSPYESQLTESAKTSLRRWVIDIPHALQADFTVTGYAADYEAQITDSALPLERAQAVADFLETSGVKTDQLSVVSQWDETSPDRVVVTVSD